MCNAIAGVVNEFHQLNRQLGRQLYPARSLISRQSPGSAIQLDGRARPYNSMAKLGHRVAKLAIKMCNPNG
ncbi:hypothetical protein PCANC_20714 [Puccinia coronata f. sp. avenae]|uniref:Uncharacterized protein n=1 Tax=Puccinia coronata f. sp. avenae TaxID=200324 RepID=A0A2N5SDM3_9BASI|nr:hypothetical protein PCANC_21865 [Puccinia coronata f. sp. avenae]PLW32015.1 hypothetical protein PCANC_20714 [Puccinia coronata f. sp. avenae]